MENIYSIIEWVEVHSAFFQTLITFFTAIIVLWYTWETRKLRLEMQNQTNILVDQLTQMVRNNIIETEPLFDISIPASFNKEKYLLIKNLGAAAYIERIITIPILKLKYSSSWLEKDKEIKLYILNDNIKRNNFYLMINYKTRILNSNKNQVFQILLDEKRILPYFNQKQIVYEKKRNFFSKLTSKFIPW